MFSHTGAPPVRRKRPGETLPPRGASSPRPVFAVRMNSRAFFSAGTAIYSIVLLGQIIYRSSTLSRTTIPYDLGDVPVLPTAAKTAARTTAIKEDPTCQQFLRNDTISSDFEFYRAIHESPFPACAAGTWSYQPDLVVLPSEEHLMCLDREVQGNCHDPNSWVNASGPKLARHTNILKNMVRNSPGILNASDPWMWHSNVEEYKTVPYDKHSQDMYRERIRKILLHPGGKHRTIYFVGDSLTRQWQHSMKCEIVHVLGIDAKMAEKMIRYLYMSTGFSQGVLDRVYGNPFVVEATEHDYVVFNFGHHMGKKLGELWEIKYHKMFKEALSWNFGKIPDSHVFFRTTSVRHFRRGMGDWNTNSSEAGATTPNMRDVWSNYGGNSPELPLQNLIAFYELLGNDATRRFRILDTSPMMLARADASFDGCHFCLPGPMDTWSRMLYYRVEQDDNIELGRGNGHVSS